MERKPLSELTNFNLIPTPTLRKLLSSDSAPNSQTRFLLRKSQSPINPISQRPPNSVASKPFIPKSRTASATSICSSHFNNDPNGKEQNPTPVCPQRSRSSSPHHAGVEGNELAMHRRQTVENLNGQRKTGVLLNSSTHVDELKNEKNAISVPSSSAPAEKAKYKGNAAAIPYDSITAEKAKDNVKAIALSFDSTPTGTVRNKGKEISVPFSSSSIEKTKDKGKAIAVPINSTREEMGDKKKSTDVLINNQPSKKQKEKRPEDVMVLSCPPLLGNRNTRNELNQAGDIFLSKSWTDPHRVHKKRKCSTQQYAPKYSLSPEFKQLKAYFDEVDAFELPVEEVSYGDSE